MTMVMMDPQVYTFTDCAARGTLREESSQTNVILQYKLLPSILSV